MFHLKHSLTIIITHEKEYANVRIAALRKCKLSTKYRLYKLIKNVCIKKRGNKYCLNKKRRRNTNVM